MGALVFLDIRPLEMSDCACIAMATKKGDEMSGKVYRLTQIVGTSDESVGDAIRTAVETASESLRNLDWFEVGEIRGSIKDGAVTEFQVTLKVGFRYEK